MSGKRAKKKARPRTERRRLEREQRQRVRDRERRAALEPGGAPERPVELASAAAVEPRAARRPCPQCGGPLQILEHAAETRAGRRLRVVRARCRHCHAPRELFFELAESRPS